MNNKHFFIRIKTWATCIARNDSPENFKKTSMRLVMTGAVLGLGLAPWELGVWFVSVGLGLIIGLGLNMGLEMVGVDGDDAIVLVMCFWLGLGLGQGLSDGLIAGAFLGIMLAVLLTYPLVLIKGFMIVLILILKPVPRIISSLVPPRTILPSVSFKQKSVQTVYQYLLTFTDIPAVFHHDAILNFNDECQVAYIEGGRFALYRVYWQTLVDLLRNILVVKTKEWMPLA